MPPGEWRLRIEDILVHEYLGVTNETLWKTALKDHLRQRHHRDLPAAAGALPLRYPLRHTLGETT